LGHEEAGYWGTVASVIMIFFLGAMLEKIPMLRHIMSAKPLLIYRDGQPYKDVMRKNMIDECDLEEVAREKGLPSYKSFEVIMLEGDGKISGIYKS
jgi:uncharacterized membrane protein YcaP (DUF421 family)